MGHVVYTESSNGKKKTTFPSHEVANGVRQSGGRLSFRDEVPTVGEWRILVLAH